MLRGLQRLLGLIIAPLLGAEDNVFDLSQRINNNPQYPWLALGESFKGPEIPRPDIGGTRITTAWLYSLNRRDCEWRFRFYPEELENLVIALDIPDIMRTRYRCAFEGIEALCLLIARFRSAGDLYELSTKYNRAQSAISDIVNDLVEYLDERWGHLLDFDTTLLTTERMKQYADAIHAKGAPLQHIWGFIDCTIRAICRPSRWQRQAYNGYKKIHAMKFQAVRLPDGLIAHLFGPIEGRRNDNHLLAESHFLDKCLLYTFRPGADHNTPIAERYFQVFGDPAYGVTPIMQSPFAGPGERTEEEKEWNEAMSHCRQSVEHGFGNILHSWPFLSAWWKMRVYASPVGRYYRVGVLLSNALNCIRPNQTSQAYGILPPTLGEYFHD